MLKIGHDPVWMCSGQDDNILRAFVIALSDTNDAWLSHHPWCHKRYRGVLTFDQCYDDDIVCDFKANSQFKPDGVVDSEILNILQ